MARKVHSMSHPPCCDYCKTEYHPHMKLEHNLNFVFGIGSRTGQQAKFRSNKGTTFCVYSLEEIVRMLFGRQIEAHMLVSWSVGSGNHPPKANGGELPRLVCLKRGKPHIKR